MLSHKFQRGSNQGSKVSKQGSKYLRGSNLPKFGLFLYPYRSTGMGPYNRPIRYRSDIGISVLVCYCSIPNETFSQGTFISKSVCYCGIPNETFTHFHKQLKFQRMSIYKRVSATVASQIRHFPSNSQAQVTYTDPKFL